MKNKKRILVISSSPLYLEKGSSLRTYSIIKMLSKKYILDICTYSLGKDFELENTKIYRTSAFYKPKIEVGRPSFSKIFLDFFLFIKSLKLILTRKYDIIHGEDFEGAFIGYILSLLFKKKKLVYNLHNRVSDNLFDKDKNSKLIKIILFFEKLIIKRSDLIIVNWKFYLKDNIFKNKNKFLFYDKISDKLSEFKIPLKNYIVYVGNFNAIQGLDDFLNVFKDTEKDTKLVLIGKKNEKIEKDIDKYNLKDRVFFTGEISVEKANFLLKNSLFTILPRVEGLATKMIAYLIQEKVILARENKENKEFLKDGYNAFTYSNKEELKEKLSLILNGKIDINILNKGIKETKKKIIKNWSEENLFKEYEK